jgi:hypothetical protein
MTFICEDYILLTANACISCRKKGRIFCPSKKSDAFYGQLDAMVRVLSFGSIIINGFSI